MKRKPSILRLLLAALALALLALPATSAADAQCNKECREEYRECCKICEQYVKDPRAQRKCKEDGCKVGLNECLEDCKSGDGS